MRKILLVENEHFIDRALRDVRSLSNFEAQFCHTHEVADLLAVIVMSPQASARLVWEDQLLEPMQSFSKAALFSSHSVALNGIWLLLTVSGTSFLEPAPRLEALSQILVILLNRGFIQSLGCVFPLFDSEGHPTEEELACLERIHPGSAPACAIREKCAERTDDNV